MDCMLKYHFNAAEWEAYQESTPFQNVTKYSFIIWHFMMQGSMVYCREPVLPHWLIINNQPVKQYSYLTYSMEQSPSWEADQFSQLTKKFTAFYGTRGFFTILTSARHLSLSWANSIQSPWPPPTSWTSVLILSYHLHLGLPNVTSSLLEYSYLQTTIQGSATHH
jgi:hypothetical protein